MSQAQNLPLDVLFTAQVDVSTFASAETLFFGTVTHLTINALLALGCVFFVDNIKGNLNVIHFPFDSIFPILVDFEQALHCLGNFDAKLVCPPDLSLVWCVWPTRQKQVHG